MERCNSYNLAYISPSESLANTVFLLVIIKRTPSLKGFSGLLLLNEQVACLIQQVSIVMFVYTRTTALGTIWIQTAQLLSQIAFSASIFFLFVININLYLAVCKGTSYKTLVTFKRVAVIIATTWIVCFVWGFIPLSYDFFHLLGCETFFLLPNPNAITAWWTVGYLLESGLIITGSAVILLKVNYHRIRVQPDYTLRAMSDTRRKMKLMRLTFVVVMIQAVLLTYSKIGDLFTERSEQAQKVFRVMNPIAYGLRNVYSCFRLCFYLPLYTPLWETTKSLLSCRRWNLNPTKNGVSYARRHKPNNPIISVQPKINATTYTNVTNSVEPTKTGSNVAIFSQTYREETPERKNLHPTHKEHALQCDEYIQQHDDVIPTHGEPDQQDDKVSPSNIEYIQQHDDVSPTHGEPDHQDEKVSPSNIEYIQQHDDVSPTHGEPDQQDDKVSPPNIEHIQQDHDVTPTHTRDSPSKVSATHTEQ